MLLFHTIQIQHEHSVLDPKFWGERLRKVCLPKPLGFNILTSLYARWHWCTEANVYSCQFCHLTTPLLQDILKNIQSNRKKVKKQINNNSNTRVSTISPNPPYPPQQNSPWVKRKQLTYLISGYVPLVKVPQGPVKEEVMGCAVANIILVASSQGIVHSKGSTNKHTQESMPL